MFPRIIYFCHKNLEGMDKYTNNWLKLNPEYKIKNYDDKMCKEFLLNEFNESYSKLFDYLKDGPIKADFWRICILYKNGGIYSDLDNEPLISLNNFIEDDIDFAICSSFSPRFKFNPKSCSG